MHLPVEFVLRRARDTGEPICRGTMQIDVCGKLPTVGVRQARRSIRQIGGRLGGLACRRLAPLIPWPTPRTSPHAYLTTSPGCTVVATPAGGSCLRVRWCWLVAVVRSRCWTRPGTEVGPLVHSRCLPLLPLRRRACPAHASAARRARQHLALCRLLQPGIHAARLGDDVSVRPAHL